MKGVTLHSEKELSPSAGPDLSPVGMIGPELDASEAAQSRRRLEVSVARHSGLVWRALRRFGVPERDVPDAAQQVFLAFLQHASEVEAGKEPGYLLSVAVNAAANVRRKLERSREVLGNEAEPAALSAYDPEQLLNEKQLREELDRGLLALPFAQRTVFVLFEIEGLTLPEIAESLAIPLGTATSRLRRARTSFEAWVARRTGDHR
jgi:RNA polymerase sigma-70 factor (ECF subfamily)